jgi:hypothetical protein
VIFVLLARVLHGLSLGTIEWNELNRNKIFLLEGGGI